MARKRNQVLEVRCEDDVLSLRYSKHFRARAAGILSILAAAAGGFLAYPIWTLVKGRFLEGITLAIFLMIVGGIAGTWALMGWMHLGCYGRDAVECDRKRRTCSIPQGFFGRRWLSWEEIDHIRLERKRLEAGTYRNIDSPELWATHHTERDSIFVVLKKEGAEPVRLWGKLGLPGDSEEVASEIATFLGKRLERRPRKHFEK